MFTKKNPKNSSKRSTGQISVNDTFICSYTKTKNKKNSESESLSFPSICKLKKKKG